MRKFNKPRQGLERDNKGHRTGFKIYIKVRKPMSPESFLRWGIKQRSHIGKSKWIWKHYSSSTELGYKNGLDIEIMKTNKALGEWLITYAGLAEGEQYAIHGWTAGKTKTHVKLTKPLAIIEIQSIEKMSFKFTNYGRLNRYWYRREEKKEGRE